jgi:hypothetical protein
MNFRWVTFIALWTLLSGPILAQPTGWASASRKPRVSSAKVVKAPLAKPRLPR